MELLCHCIFDCKEKTLPPKATDERGHLEGLFSEDDGGSEELKWTIVSLISFIPYLNWSAWIGAGMDSDTSRRCMAYAALYVLPYLHAGLSFDNLVVFSWVACAAHLQIERQAE